MALSESLRKQITDLLASNRAVLFMKGKRTPGDDRIKEHYSVFKRLMIGGHKL